MTDTPTKKRRLWPWAVGLGLFFGAFWIFALVVYWLFTRAMTPATVDISRGTVLEVDLAGSFTEGPPLVDLGPFFQTGGHSMWDLRRALRAAAADSDIAAILLRPQGALMGWANAEEVLGELDRFRDSGKPIHAFLAGDMISDLDYFLATGADRIWVTPEAGELINGLVAEAQFLRGTLEKLHIEPQVIMYKEYKSAGESFGNYEMSPYMRESLEAVLATTADRFSERVTTRRQIEPEDLDALLARGMGTAQDLVDAGLADDLGYRDQVESGLQEIAGGSQFQAVKLSSFVQQLAKEVSGSNRIAVVFGEGPIVAQDAPAAFPFLGSAVFSGPAVAEHLRRAAEDSRVKAIVFRVNSPGGSPVGSDIVRRAVANAREAGKPVVVSMADVAGSGGYWVAMDADQIVAQPATITGSIGVVFQKFNLDGFYEWIGAGIGRVSTAPRAAIFGLGPLAPGEREAIESWMDQVYNSFTGSVSKSRGLELDHVLDVARGRIWSGQDALEKKLVDRLGGMDDAIDIAKELAGLDATRDYPLVIYPRAKPLFQRLLEDDWTSTSSRLGTIQAIRLGLGLGLGGDFSALSEWLAKVAEPKVTARVPDIRVH